jgi:type III restriction enzyme
MEELIFKKQQFQEDAVNAICDVFNGETGHISQFIVGKEENTLSKHLGTDDNILGWKNEKIILSNDELLKNIQNVQKKKVNGVKNFELTKYMDKNDINLTVEMETGTGKTYAYINTILELNKRHNWTKFIIIVPSIAIREGVNSSFKDMEKHFEMKYGKKINYFIFDSKKDKDGNQSRNFAIDDDINVMIINIQAINKFEKDKEDERKENFSKTTNNIYKINENGMAPIGDIRRTNPIIIIDEPQSVEGRNKSNKGRQVIKNELNSLFVIRYSATNIDKYDMVYNLDAIDAFNQKLVKRIEINGIEIEGSTLTHGYFNLKNIIVSSKDPIAEIEFEKSNSQKDIRKMTVGDNIYEKYSPLEQYKGWVIDDIDPISERITIRTQEGEKVIYKDNQSKEPEIIFKRRIQIRETIRSHLNKEVMNHPLGIKTLSLFFIDSVKYYKEYEDGIPIDKEYANIFVEEYNNLIKFYSEKYPGLKEYWKNIEVDRTHQGYFAIDKRTGNLKDPELKGRGEKVCNDVDAFDEIMRNKKGLLDLDNNHTRFIFSHSALKEGWDNPNVFQICILRDNESEDNKRRQELGRGLRLCVNKFGERVDSKTEGIESKKVNILTVIANESYEDYANKLQKEYDTDLKSRPTRLTIAVLKVQKLNGELISEELASEIFRSFRNKDYISMEGELTSKLKEDLRENNLKLEDSIKEHRDELIELTNNLINNKVHTEDARRNRIEYATLKYKKLKDKSFQKIWDYIKSKSYYLVDFDSNELINKSIKKIDTELKVNEIYVRSIKKILKEKLDMNEFEYENSEDPNSEIPQKVIDSFISDSIKVDLIAKIVDKTRLTKKTIIKILEKINKNKFELFKKSPEEFISEVSKIINLEKIKIIVRDELKYVSYHKTDQILSLTETFDEKIPIDTKKMLKTSKKHIYDLLEWDSESVEKSIAEWADKFPAMEIFAKIPKNRYNISTPTDNFSPDWLMIFDENKIKKVFCIFESKSKRGDYSEGRREKENWKIACARKHFKAISNKNLIFEVVSSPKDIEKEIGLK